MHLYKYMYTFNIHEDVTDDLMLLYNALFYTLFLVFYIPLKEVEFEI